MAFRSYNNNDRQPTNTTYSGISFSNPGSEISQTKFSISYFNKVMKITIANRNNNGSNDNYATYDNDNAVVVYISNIKARILSDLITLMNARSDIHNVCVELKNGLMEVSDGSDYGSKSPCISISYAQEDGSVNKIVYQTKAGFHTGAYNYYDGKYESKTFDNIELDTFQMCLEEYYKASSYAIAASVMEAGMYKRNYEVELIKSIAEKVGASNGGSNNANKFNNKTFLSGNSESQPASNSNVTTPSSMIPREYETSTFDDIVSGIM
jgi:hypothetical protein